MKFFVAAGFHAWKYLGIYCSLCCNRKEEFIIYVMVRQGSKYGVALHCSFLSVAELVLLRYEAGQ